MLKTVPNYNNNDLLKYAYQICRWHHERYDGHGYPDGLVGDQIPISAQVVSIAMFMMLLRVNVAIKKHIVMNKL